MKIIVGVVAALIVGLVAGIAAVVAYAVASDQDVRDVLAKARRNVESIDLDAIGAQVQQGIADAGARVQEGVSSAKEMAEQAADNGTSTIADATAETEPIASS